MATAAWEELTEKLVSCWRGFAERCKSAPRQFLLLSSNLAVSPMKQASTTKEVKGNLLSWLEEWREFEREVRLTEAGRPPGSTATAPCKEVSKVCQLYV